MISKRVPMVSEKKSSFRGLVNYILDTQSKEERVDNVRITNCASNTPDAAIWEVLATQAKNDRATGDKTYHLLISFPATDNPTAEILAAVEDSFCNGLGFGNHQRVSAVHRDTDNVHIHVAINKIHPTRFTMRDPFNDYWIRDRIAEKLEKKYGLTVENHTRNKTISQTKVTDMEAHSGEQSLANWIKEECFAEMQTAKTWSEIHRLLDKNGLVLRPRGSGLIFDAGNGLYVKASTVDRTLSKGALEKRLGAYQPQQPGDSAERPQQPQQSGDSAERPQQPQQPGDSAERPQQPQQSGDSAERPQQPQQSGDSAERPQQPQQSGDSAERPKRTYEKRPIYNREANARLYAAFQMGKAEFRELKARGLRNLTPERQRRIEEAKSKAAFKRAALKLGQGRMAKRIAYASIQKTLQDEIAAIIADVNKQKENLKQQKPLVWADWLRYEATRGNVDALRALRERPAAMKKRESRRQTTDGVVVDNPEQQVSGLNAKIDGITKTGSIIYRSTKGAVRDDGQQFAVSRDADEATVKFAIIEAARRHGANLKLTGSEGFQRKAAEIAGRNNLPVTFSNPDLEKIRQDHLERKQYDGANTAKADGSGRDGRSARADDAGSSRASTSSSTTTRADQSRSSDTTTQRPSVVRTAAEFRREISKAQRTNIASFGAEPKGQAPPQANGMRNVSSIPMAFNVRRSQVLLSPNARNDLDNQRAAGDTTLRRATDHARHERGVIAAERYIHERNDKRLLGMNVTVHALYPGHACKMAFVGMRQVDNQALALFKEEKGEITYVLPVDNKTANRLKQAVRGSVMEIDKSGTKIRMSKRGMRRT